MKCPVFWGSHGCDLERGHDGQHLCRACCFPESDLHMDLHRAAPADGYGCDGCAGTWPYYGAPNMTGKTEHDAGFFRYEYPDWEFVYLPDEFDRLARLAKEVRP